MAVFSAAANAVAVHLDLGQGTQGEATGDRYFGIENLTGSAFNDTLVGNGGANVLTGGAGGDHLDGQGGIDTVTDFTAGASTDDVLDITDFGFANFAAVTSAASQVGADTLIQLDNNDTVTLLGVNLGDLNADDFLL